MKQEFFSGVTNGCLQKNVSGSIAKELQRHEGKRVRIIIERLKSKRSHQQNAYLHLLFTIFTEALNELGNEFQMLEIKELCKCKFATIDVVNEKTGEVIGQRIKGTSEMTKTELNEFIENIIRWAADFFHITLPYPNEELTIDFNES